MIQSSVAKTFLVTNMIKRAMRTLTFLTATTLGGLCAAYAADDAKGTQLRQASGKVLVNQGQGLVSGKIGTALREGDTVVTLDKSRATIVFSDDCELVLDENKMLIIDLKLGCRAAVFASNGLPGAVGSGATAGGGVTTGQALLIGGVIAGGVLLGTSNRSSSGNNQPISPQ